MGSLLPRVTDRIRDARFLVKTLLGQSPSPLIPRAARAAFAAPGPTAQLATVVNTHRETPLATRLTLRATAPWLRALAGQFAIVHWPASGPAAILPSIPGPGAASSREPGPPLRRAYSIVAQPDAHTLEIIVKRIIEGQVSPALAEAAIGTTLMVQAPLGQFVVAPERDRSVLHLFIAGGSGITPIWPMMQAVLREEPRSRVALLYGNQSPTETILLQELQNLAQRESSRCEVTFVNETPATDAGCATEQVGRLTEETLGHFVTRWVPTGEAAAHTRAYLCGPTPVMVAAQQVLQRAGVAAGSILQERYGSPDFVRTQRGQVAAALPRNATIAIGDTTFTVRVRGAQTLLEAAQQANVPLRSSCTMGGCGACLVTLRSGAVELDEPNCLTASERASGKILACVAHLQSDCTVDAP